jgi:hypothetical protein
MNASTLTSSAIAGNDNDGMENIFTINMDENANDGDESDDKYAKRHKQIQQGVSIVCMLLCFSSTILFFLIVRWGSAGPLPALIPLPKSTTSNPSSDHAVGDKLRNLLAQNGKFLLRRPRKHVDEVLEGAILIDHNKRDNRMEQGDDGHTDLEEHKRKRKPNQAMPQYRR